MTGTAFILLGLAVAFGADPAANVDLRAAWDAVNRTCSAGLCVRHSNSSITSSNTTDCKVRLLMYEYGLGLIPGRSPQREVFDALELQSCGVKPPSLDRAPHRQQQGTGLPRGSTQLFIDYNAGSDTGTGSADAPFKTIAKGVAAARQSASKPVSLVLRPGVHFLEATIELTPQDNGLTLTSDGSGGDVWVSGGVRLQPKWTMVESKNKSSNIWSTDVPAGVQVNGLNTLNAYRRVIRARYPNCDPELCQGCFADASAISNWKPDVSCVGKARVVYKDLRGCVGKTGKLPDGSPCKADSAMWDTYNTYANGHGGCCAAWEGDDSPYGPMGNYYCGNSSAGGHVGENDPRRGNRSQGLSPFLPVAFTYDTDKEAGKVLTTFGSAHGLDGAHVRVWPWGWYLNFFELDQHNTTSSTISFATQNGHVKGGWQGGRGWRPTSADVRDATQPGFLAGGGWAVDGVYEALDMPNEYYFAEKEQKLYYWPNGTEAGAAPTEDLVAVQLKTLFSVKGEVKQVNHAQTNATATNFAPGNAVRDITFKGIGFRDAADISMEPWGVPSGGDWGLHRGGALFFENTENCTVLDSKFVRLDGNVVFLSGYNRNTTISDNEFSWIGHSVAVGWGYTNEEDGTDGLQPRFTYLLRNYVREIGIIQKQSSFWNQAKACQTVIEDNIVFNGPRAAINFNDGFGGGTRVARNLIFNQCRETGDHGPINSWDRQPFLTDVAYGKSKPSYDAAMTNVTQNLIWANYGSSQGHDTDDGSSWYNISNNFMFQADGYKMDFGGHDTILEENIFWKEGGDGQDCINTGAFLRGHGCRYARNKCLLPQVHLVGHVSGCDCPGVAKSSPQPSDTECGVEIEENEYYGFAANLTVQCGGDYPISFTEWQARGNDARSQALHLPSDAALLYMVRQKLGMRLPPGPQPAPPGPLPPAPPAHWPQTCEGDCHRARHCCSSPDTSGCSQPSCVIGCLVAKHATGASDCKAKCKDASGQCSFSLTQNITLKQCFTCTNDPQCSPQSNCEDEKACEQGCDFAFNRSKS